MLRGVWQLQSLTIRYCEHGGSSSGVRQLVDSDKFKEFVGGLRNDKLTVGFAKANGKHPVVEGKYIHGRERTITLRNCPPHEVLSACQTVCNSRGFKVKLWNFNDRRRLGSPKQGPWTSDVRILSESEYAAYLQGNAA